MTTELREELEKIIDTLPIKTSEPYKTGAHVVRKRIVCDSLITLIQSRERAAVQKLLKEVDKFPSSRERVFGKNRHGKEAVGIDYTYLSQAIDSLKHEYLSLPTDTGKEQEGV